MAQQVSCLLCKQKSLSLDPMKNPGVAMYTCTLSPRKRHKRVPGTCWLARLAELVSPRLRKDFASKIRVENNLEIHQTWTSMYSACIHTNTHQKQSQDMMAHACNANPGEMKRGRSLELTDQ